MTNTLAEFNARRAAHLRMDAAHSPALRQQPVRNFGCYRHVLLIVAREEYRKALGLPAVQS